MNRKRGSTLFLKGVVVLLGLIVLALCVLWLPWVAREFTDHYPAYILYPVVAGMYASAIPFFVALYQALMLLRYIDQNTAFSALSVSAIKRIKYCAVAISALYAACSPLLYIMADKDDAPGILALGLVIVFASLVIATFAAVLQMLLQDAIDIKSENDLTV